MLVHQRVFDFPIVNSKPTFWVFQGTPASCSGNTVDLGWCTSNFLKIKGSTTLLLEKRRKNMKKGCNVSSMSQDSKFQMGSLMIRLACRLQPRYKSWRAKLLTGMGVSPFLAMLDSDGCRWTAVPHQGAKTNAKGTGMAISGHARTTAKTKRTAGFTWSGKRCDPRNWQRTSSICL